MALEYSGNDAFICTACRIEKPLISTHAEEKDVPRRVCKIWKSDY